MSEVVLDASALLALANGEPGSDRVAAVASEAAVSAVNLSEVVAKLAGEGMPATAIREALGSLGLRIVAFDAEDAYAAGFLRPAPRRWGLSLGDRACLALAGRLKAPAFTADRSWKKIKTRVEIRPIR